MNKLNKPVAAGAMLVSPGKSSRLQEMRNRALAANAPAAPAQPQKQSQESDKGLSPELALARRLIDQRLAEILASLPAGKQLSLFKIRFGVEFDQIKNLPIKRVAAMLQIRHPELNNPRGDMKQTIELTYNGQRI
ncbi:MAG: hypothetical protein LUQ11_08680 [Methylococcaceae bacterium]|nr:hypothetical protein [Methylococcaceae bacterium]